MREFLAYGAAALTGLWGIAHAVPTRQVVAGFEPITADNRRVILQEWVAESVALWGIALTVVAATVMGSGTDVTEWVYRIAAVALLCLAVLTSLTGARTGVIWFKICPVLLGLSAVLLLAASLT
ncbi:hypothetical protein AB0M45_29620 [Nocardia sp. NPDC051787]|uniref:hypothetical protein n=1 Tax=Nocardia sp. NPDC051787 TaxID=3155415 RepID=UPI003415CD0F